MKLERYFDEKKGRNLWRIDFTLNAKRIREAGFQSKADAQDFYFAMRNQDRLRYYGVALPVQADPVSLAELITVYLEVNKQRPSIETQRSTVLNFAGALLEDIEDVRQIRRPHLAFYVKQLQRVKLSSSTIQSYMGTVNGLLDCGPLLFPQLEDWTPPRVRLSDLGVKTVYRRRARILSGQELVKIHRALLMPRQRFEPADIHNWRGRDLSDLFWLCFLTAKRPNEIYELTWPQISFATESITYDLSKTSRQQSLPLTPQVTTILQARQKRTGKQVQVFKDFPRNRIAQSLSRAGTRCGIAYGTASDKWTLYTLRHTAATVLFQAGIDPTVRRDLLGHAAGAPTTDRYTHISPKEQHAALLTLEGYWQAACQEIDGTLCDSK